MPKDEADEMVRQWSQLDPYESVKRAVDKAVATMHYHPRIPEIKAIMEKEQGEGSGQPTLEDFKSMLRFRVSQLRSQIKPPKKLETETDKQRSDEAQQKLDALYERYGHLLEDTP